MNQKTISYNVPDMHCPSCPKLISMDLKELDGVIDVNADLDSRRITISYDSDLIDPDSIYQSIKDTGYTPQHVK